MYFNAWIGQKSERPKSGIAMVRVVFLSWIVFDHLMITVAPACVNIMSPLVICLVMSNCFVVCGNKFDKRRKEKKEKVYKATNVREWSKVFDMVTIFWSVSRVKTEVIFGENGLPSLIDLRNSWILSSQNGSVGSAWIIWKARNAAMLLEILASDI